MGAAFSPGMTNPLPTLAALALTLATAGLAAGDRSDAQIELEDHLGSSMDQLNSLDVISLREYSDCRASMAKAKKLFKPTDTLRALAFQQHPKAVAAGGSFTITVADLPWMCDQIDRVIARGTLIEQLELAKAYQRRLAADEAPDATVHLGDGDPDLAAAKACAAAVAGEAAAGATAIELKRASFAVADATALCDVLRQWGEHQNAVGQVNFDRIAPTYRALGVGGDRLELFVENDGLYFRGKRCEKIEEPRALAKAKKVHLWLENADDTHTIRTYTFTGDRYKVKDKTYRTEAAAYAGCK